MHICFLPLASCPENYGRKRDGMGVCEITYRVRPPGRTGQEIGFRAAKQNFIRLCSNAGGARLPLSSSIVLWRCPPRNPLQRDLAAAICIDHPACSGVFRFVVLRRRHENGSRGREVRTVNETAPGRSYNRKPSTS